MTTPAIPNRGWAEPGGHAVEIASVLDALERAAGFGGFASTGPHKAVQTPTSGVLTAGGPR